MSGMPHRLKEECLERHNTFGEECLECHMTLVFMYIYLQLVLMMDILSNEFLSDKVEHFNS